MKFEVKAINSDKKEVKFEFEATNRKAAISSLRSKKYLIIGLNEILDKPERNKKNEELIKKEQNVTTPQYTAKGYLGSHIELYQNKICICRTGFFGFLLHGLKGNKDILIESISSIQIKKAGILTNGYIQFSFLGGREAKGGIFQATQDENTVMFIAKYEYQFRKIKNVIEKRIYGKNNKESSLSDADELLKLANLRDKGILSENEFQVKKKDILGYRI